MSVCGLNSGTQNRFQSLALRKLVWTFGLHDRWGNLVQVSDNERNSHIIWWDTARVIVIVLLHIKVTCMCSLYVHSYCTTNPTYPKPRQQCTVKTSHHKMVLSDLQANKCFAATGCKRSQFLVLAHCNSATYLATIFLQTMQFAKVVNQITVTASLYSVVTPML
jgi:hypothetical protein